MKGYFITGTDTGVGKTVVGVALGLALQSRGKVCAYKPVETGYEAFSADVRVYKDLLGLSEELEVLCPFQLKMPLAPAVASRLEGREIVLADIVRGYERLACRYDYLIVEGAGGLLVPVREAFMMADLMKALGLEVVLVAPNRLGVLNHALLSVNCAYAYGLDVVGCVVNELRGELDVSAETNVWALQSLVRVCVSSFPFVEGLDSRRLVAEGRRVCDTLKI